MRVEVITDQNGEHDRVAKDKIDVQLGYGLVGKTAAEGLRILPLFEYCEQSCAGQRRDDHDGERWVVVAEKQPNQSTEVGHCRRKHTREGFLLQMQQEFRIEEEDLPSRDRRG